MDQVTCPDLQELYHALHKAAELGRPIEIDWVNRTIQVLSSEKKHPTIMLSDGPMRYQDILIEVSHG